MHAPCTSACWPTSAARPLSHPQHAPHHYNPFCRYGFRGFYDRKAKPVVLTKKGVEGIHLEGGTMLGTSRGGADLRRVGWGGRGRGCKWGGASLCTGACAVAC